MRLLFGCVMRLIFLKSDHFSVPFPGSFPVVFLYKSVILAFSVTRRGFFYTTMTFSHVLLSAGAFCLYTNDVLAFSAARWLFVIQK